MHGDSSITVGVNDYIPVQNLKVSRPLYDLVNEMALGVGIDPNEFWSSFSTIVRDLGPKNKELLQKRDDLQAKIDQWHKEHNGKVIDIKEYKQFLYKIGYLVEEGPDFRAGTENVDLEIATIAGPQLVAPVSDTRLSTNAANARWYSLYRAAYGTDIIPEEGGLEKEIKDGDGSVISSYNPKRGKKVIEYAHSLLDEFFSLASGNYDSITSFNLRQDHLGRKYLVAILSNEEETGLEAPHKFVGYNEKDGELSDVFLRNNGLHIRIQIDREGKRGRGHAAGVDDIVLESAVTTIQDLEDAVSAVDAGDKTHAYFNWYHLMKGDLKSTEEIDGIDRELNPDITYTSADGNKLTLPGRSLMLIRNVGIHLYTDAVLTAGGEKVPEGFLDALVTTLAAMYDLQGKGIYTNSKTGSIYIVKPKLHGPGEVEETVELFGYVEKALGLQKNTLKIGIMDEERRTTVNLKECIRAAKDRIIFINTGFLDRTGDEIRTGMYAGPFLPKSEIKQEKWLRAYEDWNVDIGIETGLVGRAQIGKGMFTKTDKMTEMMETKIAHPQAGANTAWVPSPIAAALHSIHYHKVNAAQRQQELVSREKASIDDILTIPLLDRTLTEEEKMNELRNNAQSILGYVSRWVGQGIGCSKVPDINNVNLMEDLATLRISRMHIANWYLHGIIDEDDIMDAFKEMASVVDRQNLNDSNYAPMGPDFKSSIEFQAALDLVFKWDQDSNGYTERILREARLKAKQRKKAA